MTLILKVPSWDFFVDFILEIKYYPDKGEIYG